jgi:Regulator of chromosome condensation (RCC1) repeat
VNGSRIAITVMAGALLVAACGASGQVTSPVPTPPPHPTAAPAPSPTPSTTVEVQVVNGTRVYTAGTVERWLEPTAFAVASGPYRLSGQCPTAAVAANIVLRTWTYDDFGRSPADTLRVKCGPAPKAAMFDVTVELVDGDYWLAFEGTDGMVAEFGPAVRPSPSPTPSPTPVPTPSQTPGPTLGPVATTPPTGTFTAVSAGEFYSCAIRTDGTLACWGYKAHGRATPPTGTFTAVSAGPDYACAIRTDRTLTCWGRIYWQPGDLPSGPMTAVSAGQGHACAIRGDGTLACWGSLENWSEEMDEAGNGMVEPVPPGTFTAVSAGGGTRVCALRSNRALVCWGTDDDWDYYEKLVSRQPTGRFAAVSVGSLYACAIRADGRLACWGDNRSGQAKPPPGTFAAVAASSVALDAATCAIRADGTLACWGSTTYGQVKPPSGTFIALASGAVHSCAIRADGTLECWGMSW